MKYLSSFIVSVMVVLANGNSVADELSEPTRALNGTSISYEYTNGRSYNVKFEEDGVSNFSRGK